MPAATVNDNDDNEAAAAHEAGARGNLHSALL